MEQIRQICGSKITECLKGEEKEFVLNSLGYWEPVKLDEDRCDVFY